MLWSGLYPSQKHLAWLLCSGLFMTVWRQSEAPFICIRPIPLSCALRNSAFGLQVRVISRHTYVEQTHIHLFSCSFRALCISVDAINYAPLRLSGIVITYQWLCSLLFIIICSIKTYRCKETYGMYRAHSVTYTT